MLITLKIVFILQHGFYMQSFRYILSDGCCCFLYFWATESRNKTVYSNVLQPLRNQFLFCRTQLNTSNWICNFRSKGKGYN